MTEKLTWAEFVEKYQPKDYEKFFDDRGNEWKYVISRESFLSNDAVVCVRNGKAGHILTCPLAPPKAKRKMWPWYCKDNIGIYLSTRLADSEKQAKSLEGTNTFHSWPAIPGPDGSYEVPE